MDNVDKLSKLPVEKYVGQATSEQRRMYILDQLDGVDIAYNIAFALESKEMLDLDKLEQVFKTLIIRHENFRISFKYVNNEIVYVIHDNVNFSIEKITCNEDEKLCTGNELVEKYKNVLIRKFDLSKPPLIRVGVIQVDSSRNIVIVDMHHIISDGVSVGIIIKEMISLYNDEAIKPLDISLSDYLAEKSNQSMNDSLKAQETYWLNKFKDEIPILNMPTDFMRPVKQDFSGKQVSLILSEELTNRLRRVANELKATLYMVLFGAYVTLLHRYTQQEEIIVGTSMMGRRDKRSKNIVGMFVNTIPIKNKVCSNKTFSELVEEVKNNVVEAHKNQSYPFDELVEKLQIVRDISRNPMFDTVFDFQNIDSIKMLKLKLGDTNLERLDIRQNIAKFDLMIEGIEQEGCLRFDLEYCTKLFSEAYINRFMQCYKNILVEICNNAEIKLRDINIISDNEKNKMLNEFNCHSDNTYEVYIKSWEKSVEKYGERIAISYNDEEYTYKEVDKRTSQLAHFFSSRITGTQRFIGVVMERSPNIIQTILTVWKMGNIYIPIDPEYPEERMSQILDESKASLIVTDRQTINKYHLDQLSNRSRVEVIVLEDYEEQINKQEQSYRSCSQLQDIAYVIYTSGSTGRPKGVMVEQLGMINHLDAKVKAAEIDKESVIVQNASQCFDISIWQMFSAFIMGGRTVIYSKDIIMNPMTFIADIKRNRATIVEVVPSFLDAMIPYLKENKEMLTTVKYILVTGEAVHVETVNKWFEIYEHIPVINAYGPTEASDDITHQYIYNTLEGESVPIGKPIQNCQIYILDSSERLCPIGVPGEICVSGICVGRGYLNNQEMTNKSFTLDPFQQNQQVRMYKTGDIGKWLSDGSIEFLGRKDYQVKIRGFRIELEEIENKLQKHELVKKAAVIDIKEGSSSYLCAYYIAEESIDENTLRLYLKELLPYYMVPSYFVQLEELPLTVNGKLNRKLLPKPQTETKRVIVVPENEYEASLLALWKQVLEEDVISVEDNFFEVGGHSLKAMQLATHIQKLMDIDITVADIFKLPTIKQLAHVILDKKKGMYTSIPIQPIQACYETSPAQKRLFILHKFSPNNVTYNISGAIIIREKVEQRKIEDIINTLAINHEIFRTSYHLVDNEVMQTINDDYKIPIHDYGKVDSELKNLLPQFIKPFNLEEGEVLRIGLAFNGEETYVLVDMHHIIADGISINVFFDEFIMLYLDKPIEKPRIQYKDYAKWYNNRLRSHELDVQKDYWLNVFKDTVPMMTLPSDFERRGELTNSGKSIKLKINKALTKKIESICEKTDTTMYMVLVSIYTLLLYKYTGKNSIVIGTPISGRTHKDLERSMGMFVNTLPIKNEIYGQMTFLELLNKVKEKAIEAYQNQEYPFEELVEALNLTRDSSRNPLFNTMFSLEHQEDKNMNFEHLSIRTYEHRNDISKFDLTLEATYKSYEIEINIEYSDELFKRETIERLKTHFLNLMNNISDSLNRNVADIEMLSSEERRHLVEELNNSSRLCPNEITVYQMFERQVEKTPNEIAVIFENQKLTYKQLNERANQLAWYLKEIGIGENTVVGLMVERSLELIIGVLSILKVGAAYSPIDCNYPEERIKYIADSLNSELILSHSKVSKRIQIDTKEVLDIDRILNDVQLNKKNLNGSYHPSRLMYVLFTSGSTGKPKGIMVKADSFTNLINWFTQEYKINSNDNILLIASTSFDLAQKNLYASLVSGGKLTIFTPRMYDYIEMLNTIERQEITLINCTPSAFLPLIEMGMVDEYKKLSSLRYVFLGGERINIGAVKKWFRHKNCKAQLVNTYGPTECTDIAVAYVIQDEDYDVQTDIPIGKPIYNALLYVCDKDGCLVPKGVSGELYIGGEGVSLGYYNKPDLTKERFKNNPYRPNELMYRTGDLVKWLSNDNLVFIDRVDNQVKIRGFRIELSEIENVLLKHNSIREAAVIVKNLELDPYLCAYIVGASHFDRAELKEFISKELPYYMLPSEFVELDKMPLTPNGKVDRKELLLINGEGTFKKEYIAPQNKTQEKLVALYEEILGVSLVSIDDSFFEIGGQSIKAITLTNRIYREIAIKVVATDIFNYPTVRELAKVIDEKLEEMSILEDLLLEVENLEV